MWKFSQSLWLELQLDQVMWLHLTNHSRGFHECRLVMKSFLKAVCTAHKSHKNIKKIKYNFCSLHYKKTKQININQCIGACTTAIIWGKLTSFIILAVSKTCINAVTNFRSVVTAAQSLLHEPNSFFKKFNLHIYNRCLLAVFQRGKIYWTTLFQQENQMKLREPCPKKSSHFII